MDEGVVFLPHKQFFLEELVDESEQLAPHLVPLVERKFKLPVDRTFIGAGTVAANFGIYLCNNS